MPIHDGSAARAVRDDRGPRRRTPGHGDARSQSWEVGGGGGAASKRGEGRQEAARRRPAAAAARAGRRGGRQSSPDAAAAQTLTGTRRSPRLVESRVEPSPQARSASGVSAARAGQAGQVGRRRRHDGVTRERRNPPAPAPARHVAAAAAGAGRGGGARQEQRPRHALRVPRQAAPHHPGGRAVPDHHHPGPRHRPHQRAAAAQRQPLGPHVRHLRRLPAHQPRHHHHRGVGRPHAQDGPAAVRVRRRRPVRGGRLAVHPRLAHALLHHALPPAQDVHGHDDLVGDHRHLHGLPLLRRRLPHRPIRVDIRGTAGEQPGWRGSGRRCGRRRRRQPTSGSGTPAASARRTWRTSPCEQRARQTPPKKVLDVDFYREISCQQQKPSQEN